MANNKEAEALQKKQKKKMKKQLFQRDEVSSKLEKRNKRDTSPGKMKRKREKENSVDVHKSGDNSHEATRERESDKSLRKKKRKSKERSIAKSDQFIPDIDAAFENENDEAADGRRFETQGTIKIHKGPEEPDAAAEIKTRKSKKARKDEKKDLISSKKDKILENGEKAELDEVYHISSEDDGSKGMKKWVTEYHQSRPGLKILQERIDEFITAQEERLEQERKEREAHAAEGGWTVVTHHRGRKKTTDSESGIAVGSVAQAVVEDNMVKKDEKMAKKKKNEVPIRFYNFQKKDAHRNKVLMLQSKFEDDKKRIQQNRAARKFKPF